MRSPPLVALAMLLALLSSGCDERASAAQPDAAPPPSAAPPSVSSTPSARPPSTAPAPSSSAGSEAPSLQLLKLVFTSEVKNKEPVDKLDHAQPGQRVWVHLTMRNRGADTRPITLAFRVNGDQRTKIDLKIDPSWSYRTWGYTTLRTSDLTGEVTVDVRDDAGAVISNARLPIKLKPDPAKPEAAKRHPPAGDPLDE